jgi:hypothetical protein
MLLACMTVVSQTQAALTNLFFLHHSTGLGLISEGNMRAAIAQYNATHGTAFAFWDHGYNWEGLTDPDGLATGMSYDIPGDNTDPDGLHFLWVSGEADAQHSRSLILGNHQLIAFKSCFPASNIPDAGTLAERKAYYLAMRDRFDQRPDKLFVVMSTPPLHRLATSPAAAACARQFANWLKSAEYLSGHTNIVCFDLFDYLANSQNVLRYEYEGSHSDTDSHPNTLANQTVGPILANFLMASALAYGGGSDPTPPPAPLNVAASDGTYTDRVRVSWSASAGATGYQVWRYVEDHPASATLLGISVEPGYDDSAVTLETTYYYWVIATNAAGASAFSASDTGWAAGLAAPQNVAASQGTYSNRVRITWSAVENASGYQVWKSIFPFPNMAHLLTDLTATVCHDEDVEVGTTYYYWIRAFNAAHTSGFSDMAHGHVRGPAHAWNDFDGDSRSDLAVFDSRSGAWYVRAATEGVIFWGDAWGWPGAWPVGGDYDGDGRSDFTVFDSNTGAWYVRASTGAILIYGYAWGWSGAWPMPGDYDGDGRNDLAVFDSNTGAWYIWTVAGRVLLWGDAWGWPGAWPVSGDFDGDGPADLAVFDSNTGAWYIRSVRGDLLLWSDAWGWPGAWPVSGDFDGDGASDLAVFDSWRGYWYARGRLGGLILWAEPWGWPGAWPVPGDYDGDRRSDLAVFDSNTGAWYIRSVQTGVLLWDHAWGWPGAWPVGAVRQGSP